MSEKRPANKEYVFVQVSLLPVEESGLALFLWKTKHYTDFQIHLNNNPTRHPPKIL